MVLYTYMMRNKGLIVSMKCLTKEVQFEQTWKKSNVLKTTRINVLIVRIEKRFNRSGYGIVTSSLRV